MSNFTAFVKVSSENKANVIASSLERMSPSPLGVGILEIEGDEGSWELAAFFSKKPNSLEIKILEVVHEIEFVISKIANKDWISHVQRDLKPVRAGRFLVYANHYRDTVPLNLSGLRIEAAMAFGTGHHATTVGCLLALEQLKKNNYFFWNIADIGCGTGVLAMAAASVYNARVLACDTDEVAVETARYNFQVNGFNSKIFLVKSNGFNNLSILKRGPFDLIFANILANPLCRLAPNMAKYTKKNGIIILSGILNVQVTRVERYYYENGFLRLFLKRLDQWTTIVMYRK